MAPEYVDAVVETAPEGIEFDGLTVETDGEHYQFETPESEHEDLSVDELRERATGSPAVTNWYYWHAIAPQREDSWAFLRWLETAETPVPERYARLDDGSQREWGQVLLTVTLGDGGQRRYSLRHVDDADTDSLETYDDPRAARQLATFDDRGRYRPLKTAPSLQTGWEFPALDPDEALDVLDFVYPATVENWYREREGELDVTHWHETVERQTGIYGVVETWDRGEGHDHVEWVAEACCDDSECLKRRRWQYDEETDLAVDGGTGQFPCREPCSLVISAARKWTRLEGEQPRSYEFELTPSEKTQLETLVEAVADGRTDDIREADFSDDANRWRARFLRAKLFDEEGRLDGVPTDEE